MFAKVSEDEDADPMAEGKTWKAVLKPFETSPGAREWISARTLIPLRVSQLSLCPASTLERKKERKKNFKIVLAFWNTGKGENWSGLSQHSCKLELKCPEGRSSYKHTLHICPRPLGI